MIVYWGNIGIMENRMETTGIIEIIKGIVRLYWGNIGTLFASGSFGVSFLKHFGSHF